MKFSYEVSRCKLIYVFGIADAAHKGLLKIGDTTISIDKKNLPPNCKELNKAAHERIRAYTNTAGVAYKLLHTELAVDDNGKTFRDHDIHRLLKRYKTKIKGTKGKEWFRVDLDTVKRAIVSIKQRKTFTPTTDVREEIIFRPEQDEAINKTVKYFQRGGKEFLWNAKMRFGKTLCALEVVHQMSFGKTIIVTHRPVVKAGWFDDFDKIFHDTDYICLNKDDTITGGEKNFVYFASIQDLRGSKKVGGKYPKNQEIFSAPWDCVIVDEAHEGTQTALGNEVIKALVKKKTKFLALSGTPFNLLEKFSADSVYTWDYVNEQHAKKFWDAEHFGDSNPYDELPQMNIFTYDLGKLLGKKFSGDDDIIFSFSEFFRTDDAGNFVHEADIKSFLDLLVKQDDNNYPFANEKFCNMFRHTLWIVPGVKAGQALSKLLKEHIVFHNFEVANVAGDGDEDIPYKDALDLVKDTIAENEYTITISCGKLTTGVTVPEWTAVLYLSGNYWTSPASYLQTIFRVQTPCRFGDKFKANCYVFDFAPDRALKMVTEFVKISARAGKATSADRKNLDALLKFCPVIAVEGSEMKQLDARKLLERIKDAQAERIVQNGFADNNLYSDKLLDLTAVDWQILNGAKKVVGTSKDPTKKIVINEQGLTDDEQTDGTKKKSARTPEQKELGVVGKLKVNSSRGK